MKKLSEILATVLAAGGLWEALSKHLAANVDDYLAGVLMFAVSALTGVQAALLNRRIKTHRQMIGLVLRQGLIGLAVGAIWRHYWPEASVWLPLGIATLAGLSETFSPDRLLSVLLKSLVAKTDDKDD